LTSLHCFEKSSASTYENNDFVSMNVILGLLKSTHSSYSHQSRRLADAQHFYCFVVTVLLTASTLGLNQHSCSRFGLVSSGTDDRCLSCNRL